MTRGRLEPPEFALLVSCCRWNFATVEADARPEIPSDLNWSRFVELARYHRVQGLAWNALAKDSDRLPADARQMLSTDARAIAASNLAIAQECHTLRQAFGEANVPLLFVKGLSVGALAYRSPMLKMGWDMDLLIDIQDLAKTAEMLSARGYAVRIPDNVANLHSWHERSKESVWSRDEHLHVELHTRLADNHRTIPKIDVNSPLQMVAITPGVTLPTLADVELFAYLAVHGASSAWFRLKWISDFAALVHRQDPKALESLYNRSQELGAGRAAGQALLLADALFDALRLVPTLREQLASDRANRLLCRAALRMLTERSRDPTEQPLGTLAIHWTQFLIQPGFGYQASEFLRQAGGLLRRH